MAKQHLDPSGVFAEETSFTWDGAVLAEEVTQQSAHQRSVTWVHRPGTFAPLTQSERVSASEDPQQVIDQRFYAIITDQLSMPAELVSATGAVAGLQQHTLWGGTLWHPGGASTPLRFPGQYHDPETGLHYNHQRYYDPVTGSYLTPDPLGLAPASNPHAYVPNPHLHADPLGLMACGPQGTTPGNAITADGVARSPGFIARSNGEVVRVPEGVTGPTPVRSGNGFQFTGGSGESPLDARVAGIRVMDPVVSGKYLYLNGYVSYFNKLGQTVNPFTGQTIASSDPFWHWHGGRDEGERSARWC